MKLAIYQPWIYLHGGIERTIIELTARSRHEWTIYTGHYDRKGTFPEFAQRDVRTLRPTSVNRAFGSVLRSALQVGLQKLPVEPGMDAVVVCCDGIGDLVALRNRSLPLINLCFTPLRAAFDPVYERKALSDRNFRQRLAYRALKHSFRFVDRRAWRNYRSVIAVSEEIKNRIALGKLFNRSDISVSHPGIDWRPLGPDVSYEPFVLVAGRIMWTKNIELAIRAFAAANAPSPWRLVIAGFVDAKSEIYLATLRQLAREVMGDADRIEFVISPSDGAMEDLSRRASFCLFTPLNEDWGIVPLEAMRHGKAVISVDSGGPRESVIDGHTGFLLAPVVADWAAAITKLIQDPDLARRLGEQGNAHVKKFTWDRFVMEVDDAIERCVAPARQAKPERRPEPERQVPDLAR